MIYVQNLIWGIIKEMPFLILVFFILDVIKEREKISKIHIIFYKSVFISLTFIMALTINEIYRIESLTVNYILSNNYFINANFYSGFFDGVKGIINFNLKKCIEVFGNILLFVPLGFSISYFFWYQSKRILKTMFVGGVFSILIETTQLIFGRVFDINDFFLNILGILVGYYIFSYLIQVVEKFSIQEIHMSNKYVIGKIRWDFFTVVIFFSMYIRMLI